jgi:hypothetical protein
LFKVIVYLGCQISLSKRSQAGDDIAVDKASNSKILNASLCAIATAPYI